MGKPFNPVIPDYTPRGQKKVEEPSLPPRACLVCNKATMGYGAFAEGYVCSRACNTEYESKRSLYPEGDSHESNP